ncbi:MAG: HPr family phosphocarrier protein [Verrucomicrobia bacterium]|nr:HPr family phosphocarrier protein [Verrucomicrobiota bacterium]
MAGERSVTGEFEILNQYGIHARPAALFVKTASKFSCEILVEKEDTIVSGKSIMGLLTLEGSKGSTLKITARGTDAEEALEALRTLMENKFYED